MSEVSFVLFNYDSLNGLLQQFVVCQKGPITLFNENVRQQRALLAPLGMGTKALVYHMAKVYHNIVLSRKVS